MNRTIPCISLWQPWASLMMFPDPYCKHIETRHWALKYRGPLAIHAAKNQKGLRCVEQEPLILDAFRGNSATYNWKTLGDIPFGAILGVVEVVGCESTSSLVPRISEFERACGNYQPGRYGWVTKDPRPLEQPVPYRGLQGLFQVDVSIVNSVLTGKWQV